MSDGNDRGKTKELLIMGQQAAAMDSLSQGLAVRADDPDALHGQAVAAIGNGQFDLARQHLLQALALAPDSAPLLCTLGDVERLRGDLPAAEAALHKALAGDHQLAPAYNNLGMVYMDQGRTTEAATLFMGAIQLDPAMAMAHFNLGIAFRELNYLDEAIDAYRKAIAVQPDFVQAHVNLAVALLLDGQLEEGFEEYEWRLRPPFSSVQPHSTPMWDGTVDPAGTLLIEAEQGLGDTIQFLRYVPFIARAGMRVLVRCPAAIENMVQTVEGVASTCRPEEADPAYTAWVPLLSLPRLFQTNIAKIPQNLPYMQAPFGKTREWRERLDSLGETIKVGLRWAGNPANSEDRKRSIPLALFAGLAGIPQVTLVSLDNRPPRPEDAEAARMLGLVDYSSELGDFVDTAALIANLDLVIAVDTSILHLAGALGRSAWGLIKFAPHWPWLLGRNDSPWYPGLHLFRQEQPGEWQPVLERVAATLIGAMDASR